MITCRLLPAEPESVPQPGDMWFHPTYPSEILSVQYKRDHASKRPPIVVCLPCGVEFCVDACSTADSPVSHGGNGSLNGWTVTGAAPAITVSPSILIHGKWHGWLRDGVLTEAP